MDLQAYINVLEKNRLRLRANPTQAERELLDVLSKHGLTEGVDFHFQAVLGCYIADFFFPDWMLVIELDGHGHRKKFQSHKDNLRDDFFIKHGVSTIRIWNSESKLFDTGILEHGTQYSRQRVDAAFANMYDDIESHKLFVKFSLSKPLKPKKDYSLEPLAPKLKEASLHFDGATAPSNPGPSTAAYVLTICGEQEPISGVRYLGWQTSNIAEYEAIIMGMEAALRHEVQFLRIYGDSNLVIRQVGGQWQPKMPHIKELCKRARALRDQFQEYRFQWVPRSDNEQADAISKVLA